MVSVRSAAEGRQQLDEALDVAPHERLAAREPDLLDAQATKTRATRSISSKLRSSCVEEAVVAARRPPSSAPASEYARLEERILARDQNGASQVLYGL